MHTHVEGALSITKLRIAVATSGRKGLEDSVSNVFGRANTFTVVETEDEEMKALKVIENPALSYEHGAGPSAVKELMDNQIDMVVAPKLGYGASSILAQHNVTVISAEAGTRVADAIRSAFKEPIRK